MDINLAIVLIGIALHISMKWEEARSNAAVGLFGYIKSVPAQTTVAVLASLGAFMVCDAMDWLNPATAFACGYMGNSISENIANKYARVAVK